MAGSIMNIQGFPEFRADLISGGGEVQGLLVTKPWGVTTMDEWGDLSVAYGTHKGIKMRDLPESYLRQLRNRRLKSQWSIEIVNYLVLRELVENAKEDAQKALNTAARESRAEMARRIAQNSTSTPTGNSTAATKSTPSSTESDDSSTWVKINSDSETKDGVTVTLKTKVTVTVSCTRAE